MKRKLNKKYWKFPQDGKITEEDKEIVKKIIKRTGDKPTPRPCTLNFKCPSG